MYMCYIYIYIEPIKVYTIATQENRAVHLLTEHKSLIKFFKFYI